MRLCLLRVSRERATPSGTAATPCGLWLAHFGLPCSMLGHVITPLGLIKVQLLLCISEYSQVCHRPLATRPVNLQFTPRCGLGHSRLGPLNCHANSFAICLAVCLCAIRPFHLEISFSAFHTISKHASCMRPYRKASRAIRNDHLWLIKPGTILFSHTFSHHLF
uniref:Uncharacterized protein n=1 Tax=Sander lucioperca TaxID=283035 RepID=A0A8D0APM7_SANLU